MTDVVSLSALAVLLALVPGYLTLYLWRRTKTWERPDATDLGTTLLALAASAVDQTLLFPVTTAYILPVRDHLLEYPLRLGGWLFLSLLFVPAVVGAGGGRLSDLVLDIRRRDVGRVRQLLRDLFPQTPPSAWDAFAIQGRGDGRFLVVTFDDDSRVGGLYYTDSYTMTSPQAPGIFLEQEWLLDEHGDLIGALDESRGVLIPSAAKIKHVRVIASKEELDAEAREPRRQSK